jgi:glycosyltransferase involved in cell wall biosynthesis
MGKNEISVALASYNGVKFLSDQLDSILNQTHKPAEIIVCDDLSKDETHDILTAYHQKGLIKYYKNENRLGPIGNFQKAISLCTGEYIALSDQDDIWFKDKLEVCLNKMQEIERDPSKPSLVYSDLEVVDENLSVINPSLWKHLLAKPEKETFYTLLFGNVVTGCTMVMNKSMTSYLKTIPSSAIMHDYWAALIAYGFGQYGIIERPLLQYRQHYSNVTNNYQRTIKNRIISLLEDTKIISSSRPTFLDAELKQGEDFYKLYNHLLTTHDQEKLSSFLSLKDRSFITRKWASFKSNNPTIKSLFRTSK